MYDSHARTRLAAIALSFVALLTSGCGDATGNAVACAAGEKRCVDGSPQGCSTAGAWSDLAACVNQACVDGECLGACTPGTSRCSGLLPEACAAAGAWEAGAACVDQACVGGACVGTCTPGVRRCSGQMPQSCSASGQWTDEAACADQACIAGACTGYCLPGATRCSGNNVETCNASGAWVTSATCTNQACSAGQCVGSCTPGAGSCSSLIPNTCNASGAWVAGSACPYQCTAGACTGACTPGQQRACTGGACSGVQVCGAGASWGACSVPAGCQCVSGQTASCVSFGQPCGTATCNASTFQWITSACGASRTWYRDADGDTYGLSSNSTTACAQPPGYAAVGGDCDDTRANRRPGLAENCGDGVDNNCDGQCEEGCLNLVAQVDVGTTGADKMLTTSSAEWSLGNAHVDYFFYTYNRYVQNVTQSYQLLRCVSGGVHRIEIEAPACPDFEASYGYPMLYDYAPNPKVAAGNYCFGNCFGYPLGGIALDESCGSSSYECSGPTSYQTWTGAFFAVPLIGNSCWGQ